MVINLDSHNNCEQFMFLMAYKSYMMISNEFIRLGGLEMARNFNNACRLECWKRYGDIIDEYKLQLVEMAHKQTIINYGVKEGNVMISMSPHAYSVFMLSQQWV